MFSSVGRCMPAAVFCGGQWGGGDGSAEAEEEAAAAMAAVAAMAIVVEPDDAEVEDDGTRVIVKIGGEGGKSEGRSGGRGYISCDIDIGLWKGGLARRDTMSMG